MATPLTWGAKLPDGTPVTWGMKGAKWGGTIEQILAAQPQDKTMPTPYNQISQDITDQMVTDILTAVGALETKLNFCISLTDTQRESLQKLGDANLSFVNKSVGYMDTNPEYISVLHPKTEVDKDFTGVNQMDKVLPRLQLLLRKAADTRMLMGSETLRACTAYMNNAGEAAHRGMAQAEPIYKDLSDAYPGPGSKAKKSAKTPAKPSNP